MPVAKKPAAKKTAAKPVAKKPATKKPVAKPAVKKPAAKAAAPKKAAVKKPAAKATPVKKAAAKPAAKTPAKKAVAAKKTVAKKPATKAVAKPAKSKDAIAELVAKLEKTLDMNKAEEIIAINLQGRSSLADYMIVASGRSARQVAALANYVQGELSKQGYKKMRVEGLPQGDWVIVDSGDVVIHLFRPEVRDFYQLEKLWAEDDSEPTTRISLR